MTKKSTPIKWQLWLIFGAAMAIYAKIVEMRQPQATSMPLFFWVGVIFILIGLGKLAMGRLGKQEKPKPQQQTYGQQLQQQQAQWQHQQQRDQQQVAQHNLIKCWQCGAANYSHSATCHHCHARLR